MKRSTIGNTGVDNFLFSAKSATAPAYGVALKTGISIALGGSKTATT